MSLMRRRMMMAMMEEDDVKEWKLIESIKISEENVTEINVDLGGEYSEVMILTSGAATGSDSNVFLKVNKSTTAYYGRVMDNNQSVIKIIADGVRIYAKMLFANNTQTKNAAYETYGAHREEKIQNVQIWTADSSAFDIDFGMDIYVRE